MGNKSKASPKQNCLTSKNVSIIATHLSQFTKNLRKFIVQFIQGLFVRRGKYISVKNVQLQNLPIRDPLVSSIKLQNDICLIVQGPLVLKSNFTLRSCAHYRKLYPDLNIVLSTWNIYGESELNRFKELDVKVTLSEDLEIPGPGNVNRQIVTTKSGLEMASNSEFILKTRTDIFFTSSVFLETLKLQLLDQEAIGRTDRIMVTSFNTFLRRPFSFNDQVQFARYKDLKRFWNCPLDLREHPDIKYGYDYSSLNAWSQREIVEVWLVRNYMKSLGKNLPNDIEGSLEALRDFFIVFDESSIGMYWYKNGFTDLANLHRFTPLIAGPRVEYSDWLSLQNIKQ